MQGDQAARRVVVLFYLFIYFFPKYRLCSRKCFFAIIFREVEDIFLQLRRGFATNKIKAVQKFQ